MSDRAATGRNPLGALSAFVRVGFDELLTVMVTSLLTALAAIPVVTLGAAVIAGTDTMMTIRGVGGSLETTPTSLRDRVRYFAESFADNLLQGVLFGPLLIAATLLAGTGVRALAAAGSTAARVGFFAGVYGIILTLVWIYRAASTTLRGAGSPGPIGCLRDALVDLGGDLSWTSLQVVYAATLWLVLLWTRVGALFLLGGLLALLEVVAYEERHGTGARTLVGSGRPGTRD